MDKYLMSNTVLKYVSLVCFVINLLSTSFNLAKDHYNAAGFTGFVGVFCFTMYLFARHVEKREKDEQD